MTKKLSHSHSSLEELMKSDESLKGMVDQERERWIARTRPSKEDLDRRSLEIWNKAILSRPHIRRQLPRVFPWAYHKYASIDVIPARVVTKTRSI